MRTLYRTERGDELIRLIFSDMDGTLLDENGRLPEEFGDLYAQLKERGIRFAPASGRQYASLRRTFAPWKDELIFVAENGTMVMEGSREIFSSEIERTLVLDGLRTGMEIPGVQMVMCGKKSGYILSRDNVPAFRHELDQYVTVSSVVEDFAGVDDVLIKISLCDLTGHAEDSVLPTMQQYRDRLQVTLSSTKWVDLFNRGVSKGTAVAQIQRQLGIAPGECAAFGDYDNDLELMDAVHYSFAMENALPAVKERARYRAPSNREHGVIEVCERILAGEFD